MDAVGLEPGHLRAYSRVVNPSPRSRLLVSLFAAAALSGAIIAARGAAPDAEGWVSLFNGKDLSGWVNASCAPETWSVVDGHIHCTGRPTGALRTTRHYENFILEVEWRHLSSGGNSGVFIWGTPISAPGVPFLRGIEVQVLDHGFNIKGKNEWYTTHGDVFPIHGATMKPFGRHNGQRSFPSEERSKPSPEWNHYRIVATNGVLRLSVNGREVSGGEDCNYRKGYLALESEGAPVEFRNIRIRELPSNHPAPDLVAPLDEGWRPLFTGLDLRGWKAGGPVEARWKVQGERLAALAGPVDDAATLWSEPSFGDGEFVIDVRPENPAAGAEAARAVALFRGQRIPLPALKPGGYQRFVLKVSGGGYTLRRDEQEIARGMLPIGAPARGPIGLATPGAACQFMNLYARDL